MGIFGSFKQAKQVVKDAQKDVRRPQKDEVGAKRQQKNTGGKN